MMLVLPHCSSIPLGLFNGQFPRILTFSAWLDWFGGWHQLLGSGHVCQSSCSSYCWCLCQPLADLPFNNYLAWPWSIWDQCQSQWVGTHSLWLWCWVAHFHWGRWWYRYYCQCQCLWLMPLTVPILNWPFFPGCLCLLLRDLVAQNDPNSMLVSMQIPLPVILEVPLPVLLLVSLPQILAVSLPESLLVLGLAYAGAWPPCNCSLLGSDAPWGWPSALSIWAAGGLSLTWLQISVTGWVAKIWGTACTPSGGLCSNPGDLIRSDQNPLRIRSDNLPAKFHILGQVVWSDSDQNWSELVNSDQK